MARDFSELNNYAKREFKFVQADSYRLITQAIAKENFRTQSIRGPVRWQAYLFRETQPLVKLLPQLHL